MKSNIVEYSKPTRKYVISSGSLYGFRIRCFGQLIQEYGFETEKEASRAVSIVQYFLWRHFGITKPPSYSDPNFENAVHFEPDLLSAVLWQNMPECLKSFYVANRNRIDISMELMAQPLPKGMCLKRLEWELEKKALLSSLEKLNSFSGFKLKVFLRYLSHVSEIYSCGPVDDGILDAIALLECNLATKIERLRAELLKNLETMEPYKPDAFTGELLYKQDTNPKEV